MRTEVIFLPKILVVQVHLTRSTRRFFEAQIFLQTQNTDAFRGDREIQKREEERAVTDNEVKRSNE